MKFSGIGLLSWRGLEFGKCNPGGELSRKLPSPHPTTYATGSVIWTLSSFCRDSLI